MPLIRDYVAEHERATNLGGDAVRAIDDSDLDAAGRLLAQMAAELEAHWMGEENGIFAVMSDADPAYADYVTPLRDEHRALADLLATVDLASPGDQQRIRVAMVELSEHIAKEEDGLFPASLTTLVGDDWNAAIEAWERAHPGQTLLR